MSDVRSNKPCSWILVVKATILKSTPRLTVNGAAPVSWRCRETNEINGLMLSQSSFR